MDVGLTLAMCRASSDSSSSTEVEELNVIENGTYTAEEGKAYNPVNVNVPQTELEELTVTENGDYDAGSGKAYNPIHVNVQPPQPERAWWREEGMEPIDELDLTQEAIYCTTDNMIGYDPITGENISAISFTGTGCQYRVDVGHVDNGEFVVDVAKGTFNSGVTFEEFLPQGENDKRFLLYRFIPNDENHFTNINFGFPNSTEEFCIVERYLICPYVTRYGETYNIIGRVSYCINEYIDLPLYNPTFSSNGQMFANPPGFFNRVEIKRLHQDFFNDKNLGSRFLSQHVGIKEIVFHPDVLYNVKGLNSMFASCSSLKNLTLPKIKNVDDITSLVAFANSCRSLLNLDMSEFNIGDTCTSMSQMIYSCSRLESFKLGSSRCGTGLTNVQIGYNCDRLRYLDLSSLDLMSLEGSETVVKFFNTNPGLLHTFKIPTMHCSFDVSQSTSYTVDCLNDMFDRLPVLENGEGYTITIGAINRAKLTAEELQVAYDKGWNVA